MFILTIDSYSDKTFLAIKNTKKYQIVLVSFQYTSLYNIAIVNVINKRNFCAHRKLTKVIEID